MEVAWSKESVKLPFVLEGFAHVKSENHVYFFGGSDNEMKESSTVYQFSIADNSCKALSVKGEHSPAGRSNCALAYNKGCIFVFGGLNQTSGWLGDAWVGKVEGDQVEWEAIDVSGILTPRDKIAVCQTETAAYLVGGFGPIDGIEDEDQEEEGSDELKAQKQQQNAMSMGWFDEVLSFNFETRSLEELTWSGHEGIAGKAAACAYATEDSVFIFGGRSPAGRSDVLARLRVKSVEWEIEKPGGFPPAARSFGSNCVLPNGAFLLFGGTDRTDQLIGGLHQLKGGKWAKVENAKDEFVTARRQAVMVAISDTEVLLFGGVDRVDPETGENSVLDEIWRGKFSPLSNQARVDVADVFGLKRKA